MRASRALIGVAAGLGLLGALEPFAQAAPPKAASQPVAESNGARRALPASPDKSRSYIVYLHGRIVEEQGRRATHPQFGPYAYDAIVEALAGKGAQVVSDLRGKDARVTAYAQALVVQLRRALDAGLPAEHITLVGASKGGGIALAVSRALDVPKIGYVLLGSCSEQAPGGLHGEVLSIYEASDSAGRSCAPLFASSPQLGRHRELQLHTELRHGFLYTPRAEWLQPALAWSDASQRTSDPYDAQR